MSRTAGQHAFARARRLAGAAGAALAALALLPFLLLPLDLSLALRALIEVVAVAGMLASYRIVGPRIERWMRGGRGEQRVGAVLEGLPEPWRCVHDVDTGRGNIDHVLVGPGGLYVVETKSHRGRIASDRVDPAHLRQAYAEAKHLEALSGRPVTPLLVYSYAYLERWCDKRRGVWILPARMLPRFLHRAPARLAPHEVADLHERLVAALT